MNPYDYKFKTESEPRLFHHYKGIAIYQEAFMYWASWEGHSTFSNRWWGVHEYIDKNLTERTLKK